MQLHHPAGHTTCVRLLVQHMRCSRDPAAPAGSPASLDVPDQNGQTPVQLASEHGHPECAALLLDADGTGEWEEHAGLCGAGYRPPPPLMAEPGWAAPTLLLASIATPACLQQHCITAPPCPHPWAVPTGEAKRRNALHLAAAQGQLEIAKQVLATRRLAVSAKDSDGWLPIHCAAAAGHADIVAALLAAGSEADEPAADGDTPLHKAAIAGHLPVVQLLKGRSGLDARNSAGSTPLYNAASQGHLAIMRELVQEGAAGGCRLVRAGGRCPGCGVGTERGTAQTVCLKSAQTRCVAVECTSGSPRANRIIALSPSRASQWTPPPPTAAPRSTSPPTTAVPRRRPCCWNLGRIPTWRRPAAARRSMQVGGWVGGRWCGWRR